MGDLSIDTAVTSLGDGNFSANLSADWEIWGPMGGYVAACALRAAGEVTEHRRPAALSCHYLSVAKFEQVDIRVEARKVGRSASSHRVEISQSGRAIVDAMVWSISDDVEGLEHDETVAPDVAGPDELLTINELVPEMAPNRFAFWGNIESKPLDFQSDWPPTKPLPAKWTEWLRFIPTSTFADPWVDAARSVILVDLASWPSAHRPHAWREHGYVAPSLDLNVAFHSPTHPHEWLLCDGDAPLSSHGLFGWTTRVWSNGGQLHASGGGQCLYRQLRS